MIVKSQKKKETNLGELHTSTDPLIQRPVSGVETGPLTSQRLRLVTGSGSLLGQLSFRKAKAQYMGQTGPT